MSKCALHQGRGRPPKDCEDCARNALEIALGLQDEQDEQPLTPPDLRRPGRCVSVMGTFKRHEYGTGSTCLRCGFAGGTHTPAPRAPAHTPTPKRTQAIPAKQAPIRKGDADWPEIDRKLRHPVVPDPNYPEFPWCMAVVDGKPCTAPADSAIHHDH